MAHRTIHDPIEKLEDDFLNRLAFAEQILARLKDDDCPSALGVFGGWGTGKTSLLKLLELKNAEAPEGICILTLDAWKYEATGNLFTPIIVYLRGLAGEQIGDLVTWGEAARRVLVVTALSTASAFTNKTIGIGIREIQSYFEEKASDSIKFQWEQLTDDIHETRKAFERLVELALLGQRSKKLVLCIDNLDRCSPENVIGLLESVKNYVGVPNCIWVFAMDSSVVASYIHKKYEGTSLDSYSYLDKVIPEQYHLSVGEQLDVLVRTIFRPELQSQIAFDWKSYARIPRVLVPRRIIKSVKKFEDYYGKARRSVNCNVVFNLILLYHSWPDFYERFSSNSPEQIGRVLLNFTDDDSGEKWKYCFGLPTPITEEYRHDQELTYFLQQAFVSLDSRANVTPNDVAEDICRAIVDLKLVGLP